MTTNVATIVFGLALAVYFVASAVAQIPSRSAWLRRHDVFGFLPGWSLFAPGPRVVDFAILRRDVLADDLLTEWSEVVVAAEPRPWWSFAWHPDMSIKRAYTDMCNLIAAFSAKQDRLHPRHLHGSDGAVNLMRTVPYLTILKFVTATSHPAVRATQFMVVRLGRLSLTSKFDVTSPGFVVFISEFHDVAADHRGRETGP